MLELIAPEIDQTLLMHEAIDVLEVLEHKTRKRLFNKLNKQEVVGSKPK